MGIGSSRGDDRAVAAAEMAISSPLLEASIDGAHGVLLSIQGGSDLGLFEINEAAQLVSNSAAVDANIIFGAVIDDALGDEVRVTVIAAGFDEQQRPSRPATVTAVPPAGGRSPAAQSAAGGASNGAGTPGGNSANGVPAAASNQGAASGQAAAAAASAPATSSWAGIGTTAAGRGTGETSPAAEPQAGAAAGLAPATGAGTSAGTSGASAGSWATPSPAFEPSGTTSGAGYPASSAADSPAAARQAPGGAQQGQAGQHGADPVAEVPAQPASDGPSGYVPAPVSFVSDDDDGYGSKSGYGGYDPDRGGDGAPGGAAAGWKDSGRGGKQDKVFDVAAGRRRPVVFEEEDDLDVPDFLK
jgi:cell division protein FtsZ